MTETVTLEDIIVISAETAINEKIVKRKTIVYETLVDPTVVKITGEKLKDKLFRRFGFLKPKPEDVKFVSLGKYYEPYIVIGGKYSIDYYRKCGYTVKVDGEVLEVILLNQKFRPSTTKDYKVIKVEGEERLVNEVNASLILDKSGKEVTLDKLPSAPSEKRPLKVLKKFGVDKIAPEAGLDIIRSKIAKRPKNISRIVHELFEVNERVIIYTPQYRVTFKNIKTGKEKDIEFDGVTSKRIQ